MAAASILFAACLAFTHVPVYTHVSFPTRAEDEWWGGWRLSGEVPLVLSRHRTSCEIQPAGARELLIFTEFGSRLNILTSRVPLLPWRPPRSSEIHAAGEREIRIFKGFRCRLNYLTPRAALDTP